MPNEYLQANQPVLPQPGQTEPIAPQDPGVQTRQGELQPSGAVTEQIIASSNQTPPRGLETLKDILAERGLEVRKFGFPSSVNMPEEDGEPVHENLERLYDSFTSDGQAAAKSFRAINRANNAPNSDPAEVQRSRDTAVNDQIQELLRHTPLEDLVANPAHLLTDQELYESMGSYIPEPVDPSTDTPEARAMRREELARLLDISRDNLGSSHVRAERQRRRIAYIHAQRGAQEGVSYTLEGRGFEPSAYRRTAGVDLENQPLESEHGVQIGPRTYKHAQHVRGPESEKTRLQKEFQPRMGVIAGRRVKGAISAAKNAVSSVLPTEAAKNAAGKLKPKESPGQVGPKRKL